MTKAAMEVEERSVSSGRMVESQPERVKLLLVDDDPDNLLALQAVLEPLGETLLSARSGGDALRLCLEHEFAAILLDVRMPEIDGFETAELIRARKRSRKTPILFLTGYRSDEQLFRGYDLGAVDFLFKPIVPEILQSKVRVFVELSRTEQALRRKSEALAETEQMFRSVLEAAPDSMMITDIAGTVRLANSRTDLLFGFARNELIGQNITQLIPNWAVPADAEEFTSRLTEIRLDGICRDGRAFPIEVTCSPFETPQGILITTAVRDATEKVHAEEKIRRINANLERRVAERTAELTRSNEALRQFAWAASHDLQEPVRMVLSFSQWVARKAQHKLDASELSMLNSVQEYGARLENLLADLRQYIFLSESDQQPMGAVDCNRVLETVKATLAGAMQDSGAVIDSVYLPHLESIEVLLVQIFQNLISNSIKYRDGAAPHIRIEAEEQGSGWLFTVRDNGIGIDPAQSEYIFGVFKRLHGRAYSGTGIGLAICKAAVERLGGRIWVEPQAPPGATFKFFIPQKPHE